MPDPVEAMRPTDLKGAILWMIDKWREGCTVGMENPADCQECTVGLIDAIQKRAHEPTVGVVVDPLPDSPEAWTALNRMSMPAYPAVTDAQKATAARDVQDMTTIKDYVRRLEGEVRRLTHLQP